jgi:peptide subunit release factor 1 (eRF1)
MTATLHSREPHADRLIAVVFDRAHTRLFEVTAAGAVELPSLRSPAMRGGRFHSDRQGGPGWGEHDYHGRLREEERRHYAAIAERLIQLQHSHPIAGVVLAGPGTAAAALRGILPAALADQVIGTVQLKPAEVTTARVRDVVLEMSTQHQHEAERALVNGLREGLGTGWAENGTRAVLGALARRQVRTLLVRSDVRGTGFRCAGSGRLVLSASDCRGEGDPLPVSDLVGEAIEDAQRQDASIVVITDLEAAKAIDGLAALLRFREEERRPFMPGASGAQQAGPG